MIQMKRRLRGLSGALADRTSNLGERTVLGRSGDADIQLIEKGTSRQHAAIFQDDAGTMMLMDLSSHNGSYVNGERVAKCELCHGDIIRIGESEFVYEEAAESLSEDSTLDEDLKLMSGPATESTQIVSTYDITRSIMPGCLDPLHQVAAAKGWKHCPACGLRP
jgi:pSer/pThr/pTyr-binding forkhead associated (FHA) protein